MITHTTVNQVERALKASVCSGCRRRGHRPWRCPAAATCPMLPAVHSVARLIVLRDPMLSGGDRELDRTIRSLKRRNGCRWLSDDAARLRRIARRLAGQR